MTVFNEYDSLKTVFLGKRYDAAIINKLFTFLNNKQKQNLIRINEETNEDLDNIQEYLESQNIEVFRPNIYKVFDIIDYLGEESKIIPVDPGSCRDWLFAYGNLLIITQTSLHSRNFEYVFYEDCFRELQDRGKIVITTTTPVLNKDDKFNYFDFSLTGYNNLTREDIINDVKKYISLYKNTNDNIIKNNLKFSQFSLKELENNTRTSKDHYKAFYFYNIYPLLQKYSYIHPASYFKHNNIIYGSPQGTYRGAKLFENIIKTYYPNVNFKYIGFCSHIDGDKCIIDKNTIATCGSSSIESSFKYFDERYNLQNIVLNDWKWAENPTTLVEQEWNKCCVNLNKKTTLYLNHLKGYDQRVDFDLNGLVISPRKIIGGFYNKEKLKELESYGIEVINMPLRHRWILDGGIHCHTNDIERYNNE